MKKTTCLVLLFLLLLSSCAPPLTEAEPGKFVDREGKLTRHEFTSAEHGDCYNLYTYDELGREKTVVTYREDGTEVEQRELFYNEAGLHTHTDYTQKVNGEPRLLVRMEYDESGLLTRMATYYENGQMEGELLYELHPELPANERLILTIQEYDQQGNLIRRERYQNNELIEQG